MVALFVLLAACSSDPAPVAAPPTPAPVAAPALPANVARAVELAKIVQADPDGAEAALTAKGSSQAELDGLLFEIAADPALTDAYAQALGR